SSYFDMSDLKIISLNVKGFNNVVKRQKILAFLKKEKTQIALSSETHLNDLEHLKLRVGVAILIHRSLPFTLKTIIKDNDGRYVLISGFLYGEQILIGCIYGPNSYEAAFFPKLQSDVVSLSTAYVVLHLKLFDTWRMTNPRGRDYTFFSHPHQTFSRIYFFLSSRMILDRVRECSIGICSISDHFHVSLIICPPFSDPSSRQWRMNPSLLSSPAFIDYITVQWNVFLTANKTPGVSPSLLWEAAKAYLRGCIISYTTAQKKLKAQFKSTPSKTLFKNLEATRSALNQLLTRKAESNIFFAQQSGNKPGQMLARLAKGRMEANMIPCLLDDSQVRHYKKKTSIEL
uniref:Uncharacterized protein n=1 Tax=Seriola lalandi dorsalis TaxID=1841481 RepID=A0A3B4YTB0_SERLL